MNKKTILTVVLTALFTSATLLSMGAVFAEQSGGSPESGTVSRISEVYDSLVSLGHGSDTAGSWGDWSSMWNRIRSSGEWVPDGTATGDDVAEGVTFYGSSRIKIAGTGQLAQDFEQQALVEWDDYRGPGGSGDASEDYMGEESTWTNTLPLSGGKEVWRDERTGLYWSHNLGNYTNIFPNSDHSTCPFLMAVLQLKSL